MKRIAYFFSYINPETREWLEDYQVDEVFSDASDKLWCRSQFKNAIQKLQCGDELLITRFSNAVKTLHEMSLLIDYCRIKGVRLISIEDEIDSNQTLFVSNSTSVLEIMANFPREVRELRKFVGEEPIPTWKTSRHPRSVERRMREKDVISLYVAGQTIQMITKSTGLKHTAIYQILSKNGIERSRLSKKSALAKIQSVMSRVES